MIIQKGRRDLKLKNDEVYKFAETIIAEGDAKKLARMVIAAPELYRMAQELTRSDCFKGGRRHLKEAAERIVGFCDGR